MGRNSEVVAVDYIYKTVAVALINLGLIKYFYGIHIFRSTVPQGTFPAVCNRFISA